MSMVIAVRVQSAEAHLCDAENQNVAMLIIVGKQAGGV